MAKQNTELAKLDVPTRMLAEAKAEGDIAKAQQAGKVFSAIAKAAKTMNAQRHVANKAVAGFIDAKCTVGELAGPPPGKGVGGGRGKKLSLQGDSLDKDDLNKCRAAHWRVESELRKRYVNWIDQHTSDHVRFADILVLSRLSGFLQQAAIDALEAGRAESLIEAVREVKRQDIVDGEVDVPAGQYRCIVIDPPWPIEKIERETAPAQGKDLYQVKSLEDIAAMDIPAYDEAHCYLWTTQRFLPQAFGILEGWGFGYLVTMVWHKPGGFQPVGLPQFNCEFVLLGRRGGLGFIDTQDFPCCFKAPRTKHSEKPEAFYDLVRRVSPGPRIDMFNRRLIDGFEGWGLESPDAALAAE